MTVNELIEQLKHVRGDMRVLTLGYEGGLDDITVKCDSVVFDTNTEDTWYIGKHDFARMVDGDEGTKCVIFMRERK
jgi:hypothetical protein